MPTLAGMIEQSRRNGAFKRVMNNPLAQFGPPERNYLGPSLLPEVNKRLNQYTERGIRFRTVVANAGPRYGPVQRKRSMLIGSFDVKLGNSDVGDVVSAEDFDYFIEELQLAGESTPATLQQLATVLGWVELTANRPLIEHNEKNRWDALIGAQCVLDGDDNYEEIVQYANPTGHRVTLSVAWSDDTVDPWLDIMAQAALLYSKGYNVNRIVAGADVLAIMGKNAKVRARVGIASIMTGTVTGLAGTASKADINSALQRDGLPPVEEYNLTYNTQTSSGFFFPRATMLMVSTTGRQERIDLGDQLPIPPIENTLGYVGIGVPAGKTEPGRTSFVQAYEDKPPRVDIQAWQTSLPVITEPEAMAVLSNIH